MISRLLLFVILLNSFFALGQSKTELEHKRTKLFNEIKLTKKLLESTEANRRTSINHLVTLKRQVAVRSKIIQTIAKEVAIITSQIESTNNIIASLENDIKVLKSEYAKMLYYAYKTQNSYNKLLYIFSATDFNDAYQRIRYLKRFSEYRKKQVEIIELTKSTLIRKKKDLFTKKELKESLLNDEKSQKEILNVERSKENGLVAKLKSKERELRAAISKKKKDTERLNKAIEDIIKKEIEKAQKLTSSKSKMGLTPEAKELSASFVSNKGKLPWPVERGFISDGFGIKDHPVLKGVKINNNGIDIKTTKDSKARAIFKGTVKNIIRIPGAKTAVLINHGAYFTVYSNLDEVYVKAGDVVSSKQSIGKIYTDTKVDKTVLHLEIWKATTKLNPAYWVYRK